MSHAPAFMLQRRRQEAPVPLRTRAGRAGHLTVACVLDEFSFASFSPEADLAPLTMRDWEAELTAAQPDLLLVESAWRGHRNTWWNTVSRFGPEIQGILAWCKDRGVPTAFWNKEDPVHFRTFLTVAREFDAIFTTDVDSVPRYRAVLGHENVHFLPFAAQPLVNNPVELFRRVDGTAFAGAYYVRYPERTADLEHLSDVLPRIGDFHIYDRNLGKDNPDYAFPEKFRRRVVGGLAPSEIDIAYKGYTNNLNLNSVKQSQSMFARRVYELMASNTQVISNFSRGLRTMFGDLTQCTDSGDELNRRRAALAAQPNGPERLRAMALRKAIAQHTYADRLAFIAERVGITLPDAAAQRPLLLARVRSQDEADRVRAALARQTHRDARLVLLGDVPGDDVLPGLPAALTWARGEGCTHVGVLDPGSWYGPHYLADLLRVLAWADVPAAGLLEHWAHLNGHVVRKEAGTAWTPTQRLARSRSLVAVTDWDDAALREDAQLDPFATVAGLAVSPAGYCYRGAELAEDALAPVSDLPVDAGLDLGELRAWARDLPAPREDKGEGDLDVVALCADIETLEQAGVEVLDDGTVRVRSTLPVGTHRYLYGQPRPVAEALPEREVFYLETSPGLDITGTLLYFDEGGKRVGHTMLGVGKNTRLAVPDGTATVQFGLRVAGPGEAVVERAALQEVHVPPLPVLTRSENLVVSNIYPAYTNLYRNGFVHSRVRSYAEAGTRFDVMTVDGRELPLTFREFENVDVATGTGEILDLTLAAGRVRTLFLHAMNQPMWDAVRRHPEIPAVRVWVHGAEVQPWHRRPFAYNTPEQLEAGKQVSEEKLRLWREIFREMPDTMHLVFVSQYLADAVFEDLGMDLPRDRYSIIPNPIDTDVFRYEQKSPALSRRILSVRPYPNPMYGNDLSVQAVLALAERPGFEDLHFTFCGDGVLFEETLAPLRGLPNVDIRRGFLTHAQIARLHREHGVFLVPTRMDTQGVSRDEAMSSGLVPVTSAVAAVPEFVDETCAVLAPADDHEALAEGVWRLAQDPELFAGMSVAAHERSLRVAKETVIPQELALMAEGQRRG